MASFLGEYDPKKVSVIFDGTEITGFATDSMITIDPAEDAILPQIGAQGDAAVAKNANKSATATITLMQNSPSLTFLRQKANQRESGSLTVNDPAETGGTTSAENVYIQNIPPSAKGKNLTDVTITFWMPEVDIEV